MIATKDLVTWCVTGFGLLFTLGWNLQNRWRTDRIARDLRGEAFRLDEWKTKRNALTTRLNDFEGVAASISALTRGAHDAAGLREELNKQNLALITTHEALIKELERANPAWGALAFGRKSGSESDWDQINTVLADFAVITDNPRALRNHLLAVSPLVRSIGDVIHEHVRETTAEFDPIKL